MYTDTWIVVAMNAKARFFTAVSNQELEEHDALMHEEGRMKTSDLISDKPGRTFDNFGTGKHHKGSLNEPKVEEMNKFAREVSDHLHQLEKEGEIKQLYVIASPKFLGHLLSVLNNNLKSLLKGQIDKDVVSQTTDKIRSYLPYTL